jgi:hypothetical protein
MATVKQKIVDLLSARSALADVQVAYGKPGQLEREAMYFIGAKAHHDIVVMRAGRQTREETYTLRMAIDARAPGQADQEAEARALVLLGELEDTLAGDPKLGFTDSTINGASLGDWETGETPETEGWIGVIIAQIDVAARLT